MIKRSFLHKVKLSENTKHSLYKYTGGIKYTLTAVTTKVINV